MFLRKFVKVDSKKKLPPESEKDIDAIMDVCTDPEIVGKAMLLHSGQRIEKLVNFIIIEIETNEVENISKFLSGISELVMSGGVVVDSVALPWVFIYVNLIEDDALESSEKRGEIATKVANQYKSGVKVLHGAVTGRVVSLDLQSPPRISAELFEAKSLLARLSSLDFGEIAEVK